MCGSPPDAPKLPQFPGLSPEETDILQKEGVSLDQFQQLINGTSTDLAKNKQILQQVSGLYDAQGNIDQTTLSNLKTASQQQLTQAQGVGSSALGYLQNYFGTGGASGTGTAGVGTGAGGVAGAQAAAYEQALTGTGAVNAATTQQQARDFQTLKDSLSQRGIMVTGDSLAGATSDSTAGQRAIQLFQQNVAAQNSSERLGYINTLGGQVAGTVGAAQGSSTAGSNATNAAMGYTSSAATQSAATMSPLLQQYQQGLNMYYQPYQTQQLGPYQQQMAQAQADYQAGLNKYTGFNTMLQTYLSPMASGAGYAAMSGWGGAGAAGGGSAAAAGGMTTVGGSAGLGAVALA